MKVGPDPPELNSSPNAALRLPALIRFCVPVSKTSRWKLTCALFFPGQ
jgi:hypothetical protein